MGEHTEEMIKLVSILTRAEARVLLRLQQPPAWKPGVSILTRAEARVLLQRWSRTAPFGFVSILTRAEARVLQRLVLEAAAAPDMFQSSPAPRRGCCNQTVKGMPQLWGFNPHPRRGAGAALPSKPYWLV